MSTRELVLDTPNLESMVEAFQTMPRSPDSFVMQHRAISSSDFTSLLKPSIEDAPDPAQRVQAGIQLLDAKMPGWRDNINWDILDLGHIHNCILGQLYQDDYYYGLGALGVPNGTAWRYGFEIWTYEENWYTLTELWKSMAYPKDEPVIHWIPPSYNVMERTYIQYTHFPHIPDIAIPVEDG